MFDHTRNTLRERDVLAMEAERLGWCESEGYAALQAMLDSSDAHTHALREVAAAIGTPKDVDPLDDLDGLVMAVRGLAERVVGVEARIVDAVAADRMAVGAWLRDLPRWSGDLAGRIEHGDHIDDDAPPLPSLRMVMLLRDELLRRAETLTARVLELEAERDRRIEREVER